MQNSRSFGNETNSLNLIATLNETEINYDDALWHACRLGELSLVQWAIGLEEGEGLLIYDESLWQVRKGNGYNAYIKCNIWLFPRSFKSIIPKIKF